MKTRISFYFLIAAMAAFTVLSSCKGNNGNTDNIPQPGVTEKTVDIEHLANLYCNASDEEMAKVFIGEIQDDFFIVDKDKENNFAQVYTRGQYDNCLQFYVWTSEDDSKILGVNIIELTEDSRRVWLQFYNYDMDKNELVLNEGLNFIFSDAVRELGTPLYIYRIPESSENEDVVLGYWDSDENYSEKVFKWDGRSFKE